MTVATANNAVATLTFRKPEAGDYVCRVWILAEDCGGFSAEIVSLPGVVSQGETEDEAIANLREAFQGAVEWYLSDRSEIPWSREVPQSRPANVKEKWILMHG
jgi:predicted RNase H-like HicB family nuclease